MGSGSSEGSDTNIGFHSTFPRQKTFSDYGSFPLKEDSVTLNLHNKILFETL
jgi:hypothetical protein